MSALPGTEFRVFTNVTSGSSATVAWPPKDGQEVVGSRTPARLDVTSSWALKAVHHNSFEYVILEYRLRVMYSPEAAGLDSLIPIWF